MTEAIIISFFLLWVILLVILTVIGDRYADYSDRLGGCRYAHTREAINGKISRLHKITTQKIIKNRLEEIESEKLINQKFFELSTEDFIKIRNAQIAAEDGGK